MGYYLAGFMVPYSDASYVLLWGLRLGFYERFGGYWGWQFLVLL